MHPLRRVALPSHANMRLRRNAIIAIVAVVALVALYSATLRIAAFVHIFGKHAGEALTEAEVAARHDATDTRRQVVPKIIHQVFHNWESPGNETLPADWEATRQTCIALHPEWEYKV